MHNLSTNMHITTSILPQVHVNIKNSTVFSILLKLHLFLLFSAPNFVSYFSLQAFNPYFVTSYNSQRYSESLNNNNTYTYFIQPVRFSVSWCQSIYVHTGNTVLSFTGNKLGSTSSQKSSSISKDVDFRLSIYIVIFWLLFLLI